MSDRRRLVRTAEAAKELGVDRGTLWRWQRDGKVSPDEITAGGQARWDVERLRAQLARLRSADDDQGDTDAADQP